MDELSKKIIRGIKSFYRKNFTKLLQGKPRMDRLQEYKNLLIDYFWN